MQNSPNDRNPFKQLPEALEQVEVRDRLSLQPPGTRTHIALNTDFNPESLSAHSEDLTIMQVASPVLEAEAGNDLTVGQILPNSSPQNSLASVVLVDRASPSPPKPGVVEQISSSSQPTQIERVNLKPNPIAQFSLQDDTKNLNAGVAVGQNLGNTIIQYPPTVQNLTDRTVAQSSDSAIHNPAEQTVHQAMLPKQESFGGLNWVVFAQQSNHFLLLLLKQDLQLA